jgi:hypothetical protein
MLEINLLKFLEYFFYMFLGANKVKNKFLMSIKSNLTFQSS